MEDIFMEIEREKADSIYPTDNYNQYYSGEGAGDPFIEDDGDDLEFYNRGEYDCEVDGCDCQSYYFADVINDEIGPYHFWNEDEEI